MCVYVNICIYVACWDCRFDRSFDLDAQRSVWFRKRSPLRPVGHSVATGFRWVVHALSSYLGILEGQVISLVARPSNVPLIGILLSFFGTKWRL